MSHSLPCSPQADPTVGHACRPQNVPGMCHATVVPASISASLHWEQPKTLPTLNSIEMGPEWTMFPSSPKMPALNLPPLWGALGDPARSGVYFFVKASGSPTSTKRCQGPQLALSNSSGLPVPAAHPETQEINRRSHIARWKVIALASVLGAQWGTFMPYLFLRGKGVFLTSTPDLPGGATLFSGRHCDESCRLVLPSGPSVRTSWNLLSYGAG